MALAFCHAVAASCVQDVPIRKVTVSCESQSYCFAVTGPAAIHELAPPLFSAYPGAPAASGPLPAIGTMAVLSESGAVLSDGAVLLPSSSVQVHWSLPHTPHRDLICICNANFGTNKFLFSGEVPGRAYSGEMLVRGACVPVAECSRLVA